MRRRQALFVIVLIALTAIVGFILLSRFRSGAEGWNLPLSTEYSPKLPVKPSDIDQITIETKCVWEGCRVLTLTLNRDGSATFVGVRNVERVGTYHGKTDEFPTLAGWISSLKLRPFEAQCNDGKVSLILVARETQTKYVTCDPNERPIEFRAVLRAVEGAGSRVQWHKDTSAR